MLARRSFMQITGLLVSAATVKTAIARDRPRAEDARRGKSPAAGEAEARRMPLLTNKDDSGRVSRQEFMAFGK